MKFDVKKQLIQRFFRSCWLILCMFMMCQFQVGSLEVSQPYIAMVVIPVYQHVQPLLAIGSALVERGYRVSLTMSEKMLEKLGQIDKRLEIISLPGLSDMKHVQWSSNFSVDSTPIFDLFEHELLYFTSFQRPMLDILRATFTKDAPNFVVMDRYTFAGFDICHEIGVEYAINNPSLLLDIDNPPLYIPAPFSRFPLHNQSIWERFMNTFIRIRYRIAMIRILRKINQIRQEAGIKSIHSKSDVIGSQVVLSNSAFGFEYARPQDPSIHMVGYLKWTPQSQIQSSILQWIQLQTSKVVIVDMGPNVILTYSQVDDLMSALVKDNHLRVLWIVYDSKSAENMINHPSVHIVADDYNTLSLLHLTNVVALVSSCSFLAVHEAFYAGKPILGLFFNAEQAEVADRVQRTGSGLTLAPSEITRTQLNASIHSILLNDSFRSGSARLGIALRGAGGLVRAVDVLGVRVDVLGGKKQTALKEDDHDDDDAAPRMEFPLQPPPQSRWSLPALYLWDVYLVYGGVLCGVAVILRSSASAFFRAIVHDGRKQVKWKQ